jgi:hypothetical protein
MERVQSFFNESHVTRSSRGPHRHAIKLPEFLLTSPLPLHNITTYMANNTIGSRGEAAAAKTERDTLPFINRHSLTDRMAVVVNYPHSSSSGRVAGPK